ncbi:hypothetical protein [uncultured Microscilla sp.]|uniref:hypothetical protein n=1 Tax=uncultured Microscilla sp. TaxID=432653 RepID=UPI00260B4DC4|nr:hypothetical protein [uncultured Microscilla sp.]
MHYNKTPLYIYWVVALLLSTLLLAYWLEWRHWVTLAYQQQAPDWFQTLIQRIYPRFGVEKQRFPLEFFIDKADQVVGRFAFISLGSLSFIYLYQYKVGLRQKIQHYWNRPTTAYNAQRQLQVFAGVLFLFTWDWYSYLSGLGNATAFYTPTFPYRLLHLPFPSPFWLLVLYICFLVANFALLCKFRVVWASIVSVTLFVLLQGYMYCFHKIDHTYATLTQVALLVPILAWHYQKGQLQPQKQVAAWAWRLMQFSIAFTYFQAGLEKLLIGGINWASPHSFRSYLYLHPTKPGTWVATSDFWCTVLPLAAMLFQLGFITIIFYPKLKRVFLPAGVLFHLGTFLLFGIGWYYSPWMLVYLFFIDWESIRFRQLPKSTKL